MYDGMKVVLLIESLHEECDNMDIRIRRKGFYLRKWKTFVAHYPMESYMDDLYKA